MIVCIFHIIRKFKDSTWRKRPQFTNHQQTNQSINKTNTNKPKLLYTKQQQNNSNHNNQSKLAYKPQKMQGPGNQLIPLTLDKRAYRFFPKKQQEKTSFDKKGTRFYFYGQCEHDEYERKKLKEFHEYCKEKKINYNVDYFDEQKVLLFLSGNKYKPKKALKAMMEHIQFQLTFLPIPFEKVESLIKKGYFYPCGRDFQFRPILIYNATQIDLKDFDLSLKATCFVLEEMKRTVFIPGQVECWNLIYDLGGMGLSEIPTTQLKNVLKKISLNYGGRLFKLWIVNAPSSISMSWKIVSAFLDDVTVNKVKISKKNTQKAIFQICDPSQVQQKYGGTQPNRKQFWPFAVPQGVFDTKRLLSDEEYKKLLLSDKLMRNRIDPQFADIAKGHVLETKDMSAALMSAGMEGMKLDDGEKDSDDDEKDTK